MYAGLCRLLFKINVINMHAIFCYEIFSIQPINIVLGRLQQSFSKVKMRIVFSFKKIN